MTEETPGKIAGLLGVALSSMFLLFAVTLSNASFANAEMPLPDPFAPEKIVSKLDNVSNSYGKFVAAYLTNPVRADFQNYRENAHWVIDQTDDQILSFTGLSDLAKISQPAAAPAVAGAYTSRADKANKPEGLIDRLYSLIVQ